MRWSDVTRQPTIRQLRQFGAALVALCAIVALASIVRHASREIALVFLAVALAAFATSGLRPRWLTPLYTAAMVATFPLAWLVSLALLTLIYYLVVTPLGLARRLFGHDPLDRQPRPDQDSYWRPKPRSDDPRRYFRQF